MPVTNFQSVVSAQGVGSADIEKLASAFNGLEGAIDRAGKKGEELNHHKGWGEFAEKVKEGIENPLKAIGGAAEDLLKSLGPVGTGVAAVAGILGTASFVAFEAAKSLGEYGTQVQNVAVRTGLATKEVGQFSFAARAVGGDVTMFERAMRKLSEGLQDGTEDGKKARKALEDLGIEARDKATGAMLPMSQIFVHISEALAGIQEPAKRDAEALRLFGRAGIELLPTMVGLSENFKRAKELGLGASDEDVRRWETYHKQVLEAEMVWERLVRRIKEPLAAVISIALKGKDGHEYTLQELEERGVNVDRFKPRTPYQQMVDAAGAGFNNDQQRGWMRAGILGSVSGYTDQVEQRRAADAAVEAFERRQSLDLERKLQAAEVALKDLHAPTVGVSSIDDVKAYEAAQRQVDSIKKQIEHKKELEQLDRNLAAFHTQTAEAEFSAGEKLIAKRDQLIEQAIKLGKAEAAIAAIRSDAQGALNSMLEKSMRDFNQSDLGAPKLLTAADREKRMLAAINPFAGWEPFVKAFQDAEKVRQEIDTIMLGSQRGEIVARSNKRLRMDELMLGPGREGEAIGLAYTQRLELAKQLYDLDVARAEREEDADRRQIEMAKALADLHKEAYLADMERELKLAELEQQRIERFKSFAVGGVHALASGRIGEFAQQQVMGLGDRVIGNAAGMAFGTVNSLLPHAATGSFLDKLLAGSEFGADPAKAAGMKLDSAGDHLHVAAGDLMAAARALAMSRSGGGGGAMPGLPGGSFVGGLFGGGGAWSTSGTAGDTGYTVDGVPRYAPENYGPDGSYLGPGATSYHDSQVGGGGGGAKGPGVGSYLAGGFAAAAGAYGVATSSSAKGKLGSASGLVLGMGSMLPPLAREIAMGLGVGLQLASMFFPDRKAQRAAEEDRTIAGARYVAPVSSTYSVDRWGRSYDSDMGGNVRVVVEAPITVHATDARSFESMAMDAIADGLEAKVYPRASAALRNVMFPR